MELKGKKIVIISGNEFVEPELTYPKYRLLEAGAEVDVATLEKQTVKGLYGYPVRADVDIADLNPDDYDALHTPGGWSPYELRWKGGEKVTGFIRAMYEKGKIIGAICRGALLLASAGIIEGKKATTWADVVDDLKNADAVFEDSPVVRDGTIVTSRIPSDLPDYLPVLIEFVDNAVGKYPVAACPVSALGLDLGGDPLMLVLLKDGYLLKQLIPDAEPAHMD